MIDRPPGAWVRSLERRGRFDVLARQLPQDSLIIADARVLALHPHLRRALQRRQVIALPAGEATKSLETLKRLALQTLGVSRRATLVALGGGTVGDLATVFAHLLKRGVRLIQVPTTLLAAVDSSVGGKGAVNVGGVKNALGVFHSPEETWLCAELFSTLSEAQRREGRLEAWKVALLDAATWRRWSRSPPGDEALIGEARGLKARVCAADPYERTGRRVQLNFGHTFGHAIEAVTRFRVRHGEAVGLGMLVALDIGVRVGVTPTAVAAAVEAALPNPYGARRRLRRVLQGATASDLQAAIQTDKKGATPTGVTMVLLSRPGHMVTRVIGKRVWRAALQAEGGERA